MRAFSRKGRARPGCLCWEPVGSLWVRVPGQRALGCPSSCQALQGMGCRHPVGVVLRHGLLWSWDMASLLTVAGFWHLQGHVIHGHRGWGLLQKERGRGK